MLASEARERVLKSNTVTRTVDAISQDITEACNRKQVSIHTERTTRMFYRSVLGVIEKLQARGYTIEENVDKSLTISWE